MRLSRYAYGSDFNPWLRAFAPVAASIMQQRHAVPDSNPFKRAEREMFAAVEDRIKQARELRDLGYELWFEALYGWGSSNATKVDLHQDHPSSPV